MSIPGLDAWLTREGPEHTCDPHAPFEVGPGWTPTAPRPARDYSLAIVCDASTEDYLPVATFASLADAERYAEVRNREAPPPNEDGPGGSCTVCGDFHGEPQ